MARVIAICNAKGGVGKSTTAVNLGASLTLLGKRTLLVDFDPQGNASSALGVNPGSLEQSIYHAIIGEVDPSLITYAAPLSRFDVIPAAPHLAGALVELIELPEREYRLRKFLAKIRHSYDYILIDLPPTLSLLTINGLLAGDEVMIPVQAEYYSLEGLGQLLEAITLIRDNMGHNIRVTGALLTMYDARERLSLDVERELRAHFPHPVFETVIPRHSALAEAPSFGKPVALYRPDSPGALAYDRLAREIVRKEQYAPIPDSVVMGNGNFNI